MRFYITFIINFISVIAFSQVKKDRGAFGFGVNAGMVISQIAGDSTTGFNKWGYTGGIGTYFMALERFSINLEVNYVTRGSSGVVFNEFGVGQYHRRINSNYFETPIYIAYHDKEIATFGAGINLASLSQYEEKRNDSVVAKSGVYNDLDIGVLLTATLNIKNRFGFNLRFVHSIIPTTKPDIYPNQFHSVLSARGILYF